ncbi:uncharacterized protein LOC122306524 [Carya illinoinensis]|uniref:uncharacterized protein LOC122306524 n=1 Tax=Carya illinoinensis TaxID=32201 RepID=UPI001C72472F|nr:uncharacterized protein LOC122306524 [Carya illinoinensis]
MILSWILNSLSKEIAASVIYVESAKEMWSDLQERFSQGNGPQIFGLQKTISSLMQNDLSISAYFTQIKGLWDELNYRPLPVWSYGDPPEIDSMMIPSIPFAALSSSTKHVHQNKPSTRKDRPICSHCSVPGHTIDKCFKLHRTLPLENDWEG